MANFKEEPRYTLELSLLELLALVRTLHGQNLPEDSDTINELIQDILPSINELKQLVQLHKD